MTRGDAEDQQEKTGEQPARRRGSSRQVWDDDLPTTRGRGAPPEPKLPPRRPQQRIAPRSGGPAPAPRETGRRPAPAAGTPADRTRAMPAQDAPAPAPAPRRAARPLPPRLSLPVDDGERGPATPPPPSGGGRRTSGGHDDLRPSPAPRRRRGFSFGRFVAATLAILLLLVGGYAFWMWTAVGNVWDAANKVDAAPAVDNRPAAGKGRNYLIVGSDARSGAREGVEGARTDTIMLMHVPESGSPTLVSIPRDSYVPIRANAVRQAGKHKINASFTWGGPQLLVDTVEQTTGLRVDGYLEIGFDGFKESIDSVGGLDVPVAKTVVVDGTGVTYPPGTHHMDGVHALAYVRMRHNDPLGDLGRAQRQRQVISLLVKELADPANLLLPWRLEAVGKPIASTLTMDEGMSKKDAFDIFMALRELSTGQGTSTVVPVSNLNLTTADGSSVAWDEEKAARLWAALRADEAVPQDVVAKVPGTR